MRSIRAVNLNLIPALRVLLRFRQVSRAAKALNMSQSSVSELLGALRHLFHDELVVSEGNRMRLTALAERLEAQIEAPLKLVDCLASTEFSACSVCSCASSAGSCTIVPSDEKNPSAPV